VIKIKYIWFDLNKYIVQQNCIVSNFVTDFQEMNPMAEVCRHTRIIDNKTGKQNLTRGEKQHGQSKRQT